jgi:restriction system protein
MPKYSDLFDDVLRVLDDGDAHPRKEVFASTIAGLDLSPEERNERVKGGTTRAQDRVHWAIAYLVYAGVVERPSRGRFQISKLGRSLQDQNPSGISLEVLEATDGLKAWHARGAEKRRAKRGGLATPAPTVTTPNGQTPTEMVKYAMEEIRDDVAAELLDHLRSGAPKFFEETVLRVLHRLGYGSDEDDLIHTGRSHDGGIDGFIRQDRLGLERIAIQAKRLQQGSSVSDGDINAFCGAISRHSGVSKGVFVTTGHFTRQAIKAAESSSGPSLVLIDGYKLTEIMIDNRIGVLEEEIFVALKVDGSFFEEESP